MKEGVRSIKIAFETMSKPQNSPDITYEFMGLRSMGYIVIKSFKLCTYFGTE